MRRTVALDGRFGYARQMLGMALESRGQIPEAIAEYQSAIALDPSPTYLSLLGHVYGTIGRKDEATKLLGQIRDIRKSHYVDPYYFALIHLGLGDDDAALSALERSSKNSTEITSNTSARIHFLDPLRGDRASTRWRKKLFRRTSSPKLRRWQNEFGKLLHRTQATQRLQGGGR